MRWLAHSSILVLLCASCATVPYYSPAPALPFGEFIDQVLDPLAQKVADQHIDQAKAEFATQRVSPELGAFIGSLFSPGAGTVIGGGLAAFNNKSLDQKVAALDTRRLPLKKELLALFTKRTNTQGENYAVCVEGAERIYTVQAGNFVRLVDGQGPCDVTTLTALTQP